MRYDGNAKALLIVVLAHIITHARVIAPSSSVEKKAIQIAAIILSGSGSPPTSVTCTLHSRSQGALTDVTGPSRHLSGIFGRLPRCWSSGEMGSRRTTLRPTPTRRASARRVGILLIPIRISRRLRLERTQERRPGRRSVTAFVKTKMGLAAKTRPPLAGPRKHCRRPLTFHLNAEMNFEGVESSDKASAA